MSKCYLLAALALCNFLQVQGGQVKIFILPYNLLYFSLDHFIYLQLSSILCKYISKAQ